MSGEDHDTAKNKEDLNSYFEAGEDPEYGFAMPELYWNAKEIPGMVDEYKKGSDSTPNLQ